jgi:hypothetical protein
MDRVGPLMASASKPLLAAVLFVAVVMFFSYAVNTSSKLVLFISSPFNVSNENAVVNLYAPALMIFLVALYLKNFNRAFARKCSLRSVFIIAVGASYIKSFIGLFYYNGGISTGTSIITLAFIVTLLISLEVLVRDKERYEYHYSRFLIRFLSADVALAVALTAYSFFIGSSALVHLIGLLLFMFMFTTYYERGNILRFYNKEAGELVRFIFTEEHRYSMIHKLHKIEYRRHHAPF